MTATDGPGRGRLRASHADREGVINLLKAAFVQGRLTKDEFGQRVGQTLASRTYAELAALTADLPVEPVSHVPAEPVSHVPAEQISPAPADLPPPVSKVLMWSTCVIVVAAVGGMVVSYPANSFLLLVFSVLALLIATPIAGTLLVDTWRLRHADGQLPPGPGPTPPARRGRAREREPGDETGHDPGWRALMERRTAPGPVPA